MRFSEFRNAVGGALVLYDPPIEPPNTVLLPATNGVTITGNRFLEPNVVGILIGRNGIFVENFPTIPLPWTVCDVPASAPLASTAEVPHNITISNNIFTRSWTGALALNNSRQTTIQNNTFTDNYQRPYDVSGGSMNTTACDYDTRILNNKFTAWGLNLPTVGPGARSTQALELHGLKELVQGNEFNGYPNNVILARSVNDLTIDGNFIVANGRGVGNAESGIDIWNQGGLRITSKIRIQNNTISNPVPGFQALPYGVRFGEHRCDPPIAPLDCTITPSLSLIQDVAVTANQFINFVVPYCTVSGVMGSSPAWSLQNGFLQCP